MRTVTDEQALRDALEDAAPHGDLEARGVRARGDIVVKGLVADEIVIVNSTFYGSVHFINCHVGRISIRNTVLSRGVLIEDCQVQLLDVRSCRNLEPLSILRLRADEIRLHDNGSTLANDVQVAGSVTISDPGKRLEVVRLRCSVLDILGEAPSAALSSLRVAHTTVAGAMTLRGFDAREMHLERIGAAEFYCERCDFNTLTLERAVLGGASRLERLGALTDGATIRISGRCAGDLVIRNLGSGTAAVLNDLNVLGDLTIRGPADVELRDCRVRGALRPFSAPNDATPTKIGIAAETRLSSLEVPPDPIRSLNSVEDTADRMLGGHSKVELAVLTNSLHDRPGERDLAYYALRTAEARESDFPLGQALRLAGWVSGWGVRIVAPLRALLLGVALTALGLLVSGADLPSTHRPWSLGAIADTIAVASALWLNVGTGLPQELRGAGWTLVSTLCAALGLVLITLIVGIAIRKLVRL